MISQIHRPLVIGLYDIFNYLIYSSAEYMINKDLLRINRLMIIGTLYHFYNRASDISAITYILN
jgi:hypothetical protein